MKIWQTLLNLILPPRCIKCGKILSVKNGLCAECFSKITFISEPMCHHCGIPFNDAVNIKFNTVQYCGKCLQKKKFLFELQRSAFIYNDESKDLILDLKFRDKTAAAEILANLLYTAGSDIWKEQPDILMPVPIHHKRLMQRRYNQSALLCRYLVHKTGIDADYTSLQRCRNTIPQVQLSGAARRNNLKHAFTAVKPQNIRGKKIVLIDDVATTGSTLNECAKVLHKAGAAAIYSLTLARTQK
ncbi:MAG: ComF family protein [Alphaproteobacteria bacterium]|nr:ComF family protein [Alphaproteobacteria bacterium]